MILFLSIVFIVYFFGLIMLMSGWKTTLRVQVPGSSPRPLQITVVIPFRNEENNLANLIDDLRQQQRSGESTEIVFVDDHSTDRSVEIINALISEETQFKIVALGPDEFGKKHAIMHGITNATGSIIVTTDADCRLPVTWLHSIADYFDDSQTRMVFGGVRMKGEDTFFSNLQAVEFCSLIGAGAATAALGNPILCNGANLAFLKTTFNEVDGYQGNLDIPSGDDEFLMRKIQKKFPGSIKFIAVPDNVVDTRPSRSWSGFFSQRLRWAGKWKRNGSAISRVIALLVWMAQVTFAYTWIMLFVFASSRQENLILAILLAIKLLLEYRLISGVAQFLKVNVNGFAFFVLQLIYPWYVIVVGVASLFTSPQWKDRPA